MVAVSGPNPNAQSQDVLGLKQSTQSGIANITESIMTGDNIGKSVEGAAMGVVEGAVDNVKKSVTQVIKDALVGAIKRLFIGNDKADAATAKGKTAANVAGSAAKITATQQKLLDAGLGALKDLLMTGEIDINAAAGRIKDAVKLINDKNGAATALNEQKQEAMEANEEIVSKLKEYGISVSVQKSEGDSSSGQEQTILITQKGPDGKPIQTEMPLDGGSKDKDGAKVEGMPPEAQELLSQFQANLALITSIDASFTEMSTETSATVAQIDADQQSIATGKEQLTQNLQTKSTEVVTNAVGGINSEVTGGNVVLQSDAVNATVNAGVDTGTAAAAPGIAAGLTAGTFGFGSGEAAKVTANGIADGAAAAVRTLTGSSAAGGIVSNLASGKSLSAALETVVVNEVNGMISGQINELASGLQIGELDVGALVAPELSAALEIKPSEGGDKPQQA